MPIQILPIQLANQIAAGEVVERPSSVVKELVENSLDAGANEIEIEIDRGGHKRIAIRDNGGGISKAELELALSRHATSKIKVLDDLEAIQSLGFRGEALASISSVSRLTLTSKPAEQQQGWQAKAEGRDMQIVLRPAAHPNGTSIEVVDLFFNTPARRKFLRAEKTEFSHIDEIVKRIALSQFAVGILLKHNGKVIRKYPKAASESARKRRLGLVFGSEFAENAVALGSAFESMQLSGWISPPGYSKHQNDLQYVYVNGRVMRDKLINHAIRQAYDGLIANDTHAAFVLYLTIEPQNVDVNVHPAKHEVRFHQSRLVHDFIFRSISDALGQSFQAPVEPRNEPFSASAPNVLAEVEPKHQYIKPLMPRQQEYQVNSNDKTASATNFPSSRHGESAQHPRAKSAPPQRHSSTASPQQQRNYQNLMRTEPTATHKDNDIQWVQIDSEHLLIRMNQALHLCAAQDLLQAKVMRQLQNTTTRHPLLMPVSIALPGPVLQQAERLSTALQNYAVETSFMGGKLLIKQVPAGMRGLDWASVISEVINALQQNSSGDLSEQSNDKPPAANSAKQDTHKLVRHENKQDTHNQADKDDQLSEIVESDEHLLRALTKGIAKIHLQTMYHRTHSFQFLVDELAVNEAFAEYVEQCGKLVSPQTLLNGE